MRRKDREITDPKEITNIILQSKVCRLGFCDENIPYVVPMSFGYKEVDGKRVFYFHGAKKGRKLDLINKTHFACLEIDCGYELIQAEEPCDYSAKFKSVIGTGKISLIESNEEKKVALSAIMEQNTGKSDWNFPALMLMAVAVYKLEIEEISAKEHK